MRSSVVKAALEVLAIVAVAAAAVFPRTGQAAWDKVTTGKVHAIEYGADGVFSFSLVDSLRICPPPPDLKPGEIFSPTVGLVPPSHAGAKQILAGLMLAKAAGLNVVVYANTPTDKSWGCYIGAIDVF